MQILLKLAYAFSPAEYLASAFIFCCIFFPASLKAQEPPRPEIDINTFIQNLLPIPTEDADYTDVYEALFQLYTNPLDLNQATRDELSAVFVLSEIQLNAFIDYREKSGALLSLYELQAIPGFDLTTIGKLLPFVTVEPRQITLRESFKNPTQHFLLLRSAKLLEQQKGYSSLDSTSRSATRYAGNHGTVMPDTVMPAPEFTAWVSLLRKTEEKFFGTGSLRTRFSGSILLPFMPRL